MRLLLLVCFVGLVVAHDNNLDSTWNLFKQKHDKVYTGIQEATRRAVWERAIRFIQQHNLEADLGLHTYWVGLNEYSDLTDEEYKNYLTGYRGNSTRKSTNQFMAPSHVTFPDEVDWRQEGYVTEVKNQKQCGSCWAFSTTGSLEGQHFKKTGRLVSLSEQNLVDCSRRNFGCHGGFVDVALQYIKDNSGIDTEESYPYEARDGQCRFQREDVGATDAGFVDIPKGSETLLKQAVATIGPVSVAIDASHKSFQHYRSGVYNEPRCSSVRLDHAVLVVGYGTEGDDDYWLVKNSWGDSWGNDGYIKMSRGRNNQCGIASAASYPLV